MITIHHLEVQFDVEGEGDEAVFVRYFQKYIRQWQRLDSELQARHREAERDRTLGDQDGGYRPC